MTAVPQETLPLGSVIGGKYRILRRIGEGGMGAVYEAENELTNKRVAIKWLHPTLASSLDAVRRMLREAQASARIRHPHVVDVYDVGQEDNSVFLVMEFLEGETLRDVLSARRLSISELVSLLLPAMRGTAAAHAQGIVHRDIKPDNIFLARVLDTPAPVPKVLDFGISKFEVPGTDAATLTQSGIAMGTPLYMSFEQLSGAKDVDGRADVYAFGVILYEALTGKPPFQADSFAGLAVKVATQTPAAPSTITHDIPRELDAIVMKAIAREREHRYPTLEALILDLEPFGPIEARSSTPRSSGASLPTPANSSAPVAFAKTMQSPANGHPTVKPKRSQGLWALVLTLLAVVGASAFFLREVPAREAPADVAAQPAVPQEQPSADKAQATPPQDTAEATIDVPPSEPSPREPTSAKPEDQAPAQADSQRIPRATTKGRDERKPVAAPELATSARANAPSTPQPANSEPRAVEAPPGMPQAKTNEAVSLERPPQANPPQANTAEKPVSEEKDKRFRAGQPRIDQF